MKNSLCHRFKVKLFILYTFLFVDFKCLRFSPLQYLCGVISANVANIGKTSFRVFI